MHGIVVQAEVGDGGEEFAVRLHLQKRADGDEPLNLSIVLEDLLDVVFAAGHDLEIADDGRPVAWTEGEGKGSYGVERLEDIALAVYDGAAERRIKIVSLQNAPGEQLLGLAVAGFDEEPLGDAVFDLAGVRQGGIGIEANKIRNVVYSAYVVVRDCRFDRVFVPLARFVFVERGAIEKAFESGQAEVDGEFAGVAGEVLGAQLSGCIVGIAVVSGSEGRRSGDAQPVAEVERKCDSRGKFDARHKSGGTQRSVILAV